MPQNRRKMPSFKAKTVSFTEYNELVQYILKSGLILDEDMDCILTHFNADDENISEGKLSVIQKVLSGISITGSIFVVQKSLSMLYLPLAAAPLLLVGIQRLRAYLTKKNQRLHLKRLIKALCDTSKMNRMICEYFRIRNSINPATANVIDPFTRGMRQLIEMVFYEEVNFLYAFRGFAWQFGEYVDLLKVDYEYLENLDFEQFTMNNIGGINDCVIFLQNLCDIFVLVVSSTLTCLAVVLCPNLSLVNDIDVNEVLNTIVPRMTKMSVNCYNKIDKKFDDVKYHHLYKTQVQKQSKPPVPSSSSKLYSSICKVMTCSSDILEKSQTILIFLRKRLQTKEEKKQVSACIAELRTQVFDFYQNLDVLHKLYEISIDQGKPAGGKSETSSTSSKDSLQVERIIFDASLNPNEPSDDEEYEAFVEAEDILPVGTSQSFLEEQESRRFASLLGQELRQKLRTHDTFIAARQRRGIMDEEPPTDLVVNEPPEPEEEPSPRRPLFPLDENDVSPPIPIPPPRPLPNGEVYNIPPRIPPPCPPPPPPMNLGPAGDSPRAHETGGYSLVEAMKAASRRPVEVFETEDSDKED